MLPPGIPFNRRQVRFFHELALGVTDERRLGYALKEIG